jgi:hypothetical protein
MDMEQKVRDLAEALGITDEDNAEWMQELRQSMAADFGLPTHCPECGPECTFTTEPCGESCCEWANV